ncbi:MAG: PQQ-dependent sugar dehydrogenase [Leptolyngbyaceae cyanobacterium T60_A2020_046]|nr:PQQ-dependent sugar dehydrogenase [Leptolyngbyaceae cyanobacterium T60_A2020_046]
MENASRWQRFFAQGLAIATLASCAATSSTPLESTATDAPVGATAPPAESVAQTTTPVEVTPVTLVEGLENPWGMAWLPNGDILVTERPGRLRIIRDGQLDPTPIAGVPQVFAVGQGGLLDIALHPNFAENYWVYFTYSDGTRDANRTQVARARLEGDRLSEWTVIFEVDRAKPSTQHFGARLAWLPDGTLLVAIGDGGNSPVQLDGDLIRNQAQNLQSRLGKIVRIREDGSIPPDNPFVNREDADPLIWSYGHRNIQGLDVDPETGVVWSTEHGPRGGDELNQIQPGENYGWPVVTHGREYSGSEITAERSRPGMVDPLQIWTPSKAPSGLVVYRGDRYPTWQGQLFSGGLVTRDVRRIELDDAGTVVNESAINIGQRVRDVREGPDGWLYVLTDEPNGRLIRLEPMGG